MPELPPSTNGLYGLVDMGSNGIRLSITNLSPPTTRALPTVYQSRLPISLYDAQYPTPQSPRIPIPSSTISAVLSGLKRFQIVCSDFGVEKGCVKILATEATRTAINSEEFRKEVERVTGWEVGLLSHEEEGRVGALGAGSSLGEVEGLVCDLGGGSVQLTYLTSPMPGPDEPQPPAVSLPYGAAALTRLLANSTTPQTHSKLLTTLTTALSQAFKSLLPLPPTLTYAAQHQGLPLYLSGGGFRGLAALHLHTHRPSPYPIPIINGFTLPKSTFSDTTEIEALAASLSLDSSSSSSSSTSASASYTSDDSSGGIFRVSKRRASQVPAVATLVRCLVEAVPCIREVRFCQGGVREGWWFGHLPPQVRVQGALEAATSKHACPDAERIAELLWDSLPGRSEELDRSVPGVFSRGLVRAIANLMYLGGDVTKDGRAVGGLMCLITGVGAGVHGVGHVERAVVGLVLCRRWGGEVPGEWYEGVREKLRGVISPQEGWWAEYLGGVAGLVGEVYPAGRVGAASAASPGGVDASMGEGGAGERLKIKSVWAEGLGKKGLSQGVKVKLRGREGDVMMEKEAVNGLVEDWEKVGKKKRWVRGFGVPVRVDVERVGEGEEL